MAEEFCTAVGLLKTMRFDVVAHGHDTACVLARAFCHRMQHYFSAYVEHPLEEGQAFGQAVHDAYAETSELRRLVEGELSARTRARVLAIRAIGR